MLKIIPFLFLLLTCHSAQAAQNSTPTMTEIQHLIEQGNSTAAVTDLQHLVKAEPENYQAWFLLGVTQAEQHHFKAAIHAFHQVVSLQPKLAEPHNNLAVIYDEMGKIRAAVNELEASLVLKPGYITAQENLGDLYIKLAADAYQKVLARSDNPVLQRRYQRLLQLPSDSIAAKAPQTANIETKQDTLDHLPASNKNKVIKTTDVAEKTITPLPTAITKKQPATQTTQHETLTTSASTTTEETPPPVPLPPTSTSPAAATLNDTSTEEALQALEAWRLAWSNQNTDAYFSAYSNAFQYGDRYDSLENWKNYKTWAMQKRQFIHIKIEKIVSTVMTKGLIKISFLQHFRSDSFSSDDRKEMLFKKTANGWKITYEASM